MRRRDRAPALLAAASSVLGSVAGTYGLAVASGASVWALKNPSLGAAYLMYLWAGVGLIRLPVAERAVRRGRCRVGGLAGIVHPVLHHLAEDRRPDCVWTHWPLAPLNRLSCWTGPTWALRPTYYLGAQAGVWGITTSSSGAALVKMASERRAAWNRMRQRGATTSRSAVTAVYL